MATQNRNGREKTVKGQKSNYRIVQVSTTRHNGFKKTEVILNIWENEYLNVRSAENKIKGIKVETMDLGEGWTNTIKLVIMTNGDIERAA